LIDGIFKTQELHPFFFVLYTECLVRRIYCRNHNWWISTWLLCLGSK